MTFPNWPQPTNWLATVVKWNAYAYETGGEYSFSGDISDNSEMSWNSVTWMDARTQPTYAYLSDPAFQQEAFNGLGGYLSSVYQPTDHSQIASNTSGISTLTSSLSSLSGSVGGKVSTSTTVNGHALSSNVTVTSADVSLGNCDNTSDIDKPISTATQTALNAKAATSHTHAESDITNLATDLAKKPTVYFGSTLKSNAVMWTGSATVSSGVAVVYLTTDGTSTGTAVFPNGPNLDSINAFVSDSSASYQMAYALTNSNKTLTITANKLTTANILTGILGQASANSAVIRLTIWGS